MLYSFGPYQIDARQRRLTRNGEPVAVPDRQLEVLLQLAAKAGQVVSKDALVEVAWKDVAVTDNSLEQAISNLRRTLGAPDGGGRYIETLARRGYRMGVPVTVTASRHSDSDLAAMLAPFRAFVEGRAALETLDADSVAKACTVFEGLAHTWPDNPAAHLGLANALALRLESTRAAGRRDEQMLKRALHHASEACRLDPSSGEAWAALGLACHQARDREQAIAALRRAVSIEPDNWRHHVRLAYVSWGEDRLRAAQRALALLPGVPFAHWLAATVHIARQSLPAAEMALASGAAAQDEQRQGTPFRAAGLHLLLGLVRLAGGDEDAALREFDRETGLEPTGSIYRREASANAWCAIGAVRLRRGDRAGALEAFDRASEVVPRHVVALAAHAALVGGRSDLDERLAELRHEEGLAEAAHAEAVYDTLRGRVSSAAERLLIALEGAPPGSSAWSLPVDPFLRVGAHPDDWHAVLSRLRARAA